MLNYLVNTYGVKPSPDGSSPLTLKNFKVNLPNSVWKIDRLFTSLSGLTGLTGKDDPYNKSLPLKKVMLNGLKSIKTIQDLSQWKKEKWDTYVTFLSNHIYSISLTMYMSDTNSRISAFNGSLKKINKQLFDLLGKGADGTVSSALVGGIDWTEIDKYMQYDGNFKGIDLSLPLLSKKELEGLDLEKEEQTLRNYLATGFNPNGDRLKRLLAGLFQKDEFSSQQLDLLRLSQNLCNFLSARGLETTPDQRAFILITETGLFLKQGAGKASIKPSLN